jgi:pimeloyl-ACP methyl ester carboxylesterase
VITHPVVVLHDVGDELGGGPWATALTAAGWTGRVLAPDLPGHAGAPPPEGGNYESADTAYVLVPLLAELGEPAVVVGVGVNGWNAELCGLAGKALAVVLVDGIGAPWITPTAAVHWQREWLRSIADDEAAVAPPPSGGRVLDPRLRHGLPPHGSRRLALRGAARLDVPLVLLESPASAAPPGDAEAIASECRAGGFVVPIPDRTPETVASAIVHHLTVADEELQHR